MRARSLSVPTNWLGNPMTMNIDEEWYRRDRSFRIIGNDQVGYHVRACGNHRVLSDPDEPIKTLEAARIWLTTYYPGAILHRH